MQEKKVIHIKQDTSNGARESTASNVKLKCGDCMFLEKEAHPSYGMPCEERGIKSFATAPGCYTPNVKSLASISVETFDIIGQIVSACTPSQSRIIMGLFKTQAQLSKLGFYLMQPVFFKVGSEDYLDNYLKGFAMGVGPNKEILLLSTPVQKKNTVYAAVCAESLMDEFTFADHRKYLLESGRIYQPRVPHKNLNVDDESYQVPTIETSEDLLNSLATASPKKKPKANSKEAPVRERGSKSHTAIDVSGILTAD
jgi:hypothetical protein